MGGGDNALGFSKPAFEAACVITHAAFGPTQRAGGQAQDVRHSVGHFAGASFEDASAADAVVGAEAKPTGKGFGAAELFAHVVGGAQFAHEHAKHTTADPGHGTQVYAEEAICFLVDGQWGGHVLLQPTLEPGSLRQRRVGDPGNGGSAPGHFGVALGYCRAEFLPARLALAQNEEIFLTVIATQGADDLGQRGTAAPVAQSGEFFGVALTGQYCGDDRLRADTIDVAQNVVDVQIHFGHHLLHELHLLAGLGDQIGPVAKVILEVSRLTDDEIRRGSESIVGGGAAFVKTGTGWTREPTTLTHIGIINAVVQGKCRIKASGRIRNLETIKAMLSLGVTRFGINTRMALKLLNECAL